MKGVGLSLSLSDLLCLRSSRSKYDTSTISCFVFLHFILIQTVVLFTIMTYVILHFKAIWKEIKWNEPGIQRIRKTEFQELGE